MLTARKVLEFYCLEKYQFQSTNQSVVQDPGHDPNFISNIFKGGYFSLLKHLLYKYEG